MSEISAPRRALHLVIEGLPAERWRELESLSQSTSDVIEVFQLTETNAKEALEKIFAADAVAVWGKI